VDDAGLPREPLAADAGVAPALPDVDASAQAPVPVVPEPAPSAPVEVQPAAGEAPLAEATPAPETPAEVTVVGTRLSRTAGSAHVINEKQLQRFEYDDPTAVLMSTPGLYVRTEDGMGLRPNIGLRGVNPDRSKKVTLLEDGILFGPAPYSAPAAYFFPIITRATKVRVIKGPAAIGYGPQTVAGAIDIVTRAIPDEAAASADVAVGQYGYGKAHVWAGASNDRFGVLIEGVRLQNNGFKELPSGADTGFVRNEWMVKGRYVIDSDTRHELRLKLTYSDEVSNESYLGLTDEDFRANPNRRYGVSQLDRMANHRTSVVLTHQIDPRPNLSITTNVYRHDFERTWRKVNEFPEGASLFNVLRSPGDFPMQVRTLRGQVMSAQGGSIMIGPNERSFTSAGVESRLRWDEVTGDFSHRLEAGARYHYDLIERRHSQSRYTVFGDELFPTDQAAQVTAFNREWTHAVALHLQYALTFRDLTLTPGIRTELIRSVSEERLVEQPDQTDFTHGILPGVGAYYGIYRGLGVLGGVYRGFSPPPPGSANSVDPEQSINYEAGARYTAGALRLESVYFYNDYQNLTDYCSQSSGCRDDMVDMQFDAGSARIYGVEVLAEHDLRVRKFVVPLQLAYTFTRGEFGQSFLSQDPIWGDVQKGDELPYLPRHQVRAQLGIEHRIGGINAALTYVGAMREEPGRGTLKGALATEEQFLVDLSGFANVWGPLSIYANVQNLMNEQYIVSRRPFGARPNAPRWVHVGLKANF
jgi:Fe(3+) dicitrate transport protein